MKRYSIYNLISFLFAMMALLILTLSGCVAKSKYLAQVAEAESANTAFQDEAKKNAALNEQVSRLNSLMAEQRTKIEKLEKEKEEVARKIDELSSVINGLNADLEKTKEASGSDIDKFMSEIAKLQGERDEAKKKIEELSSEVDRLALKEREAQGRITEISSELKPPQEQPKAPSPEEERLREEVAKLETERGDLKKQVAQLSSEIDRLNSELNSARIENSNLKGRIEGLSSEAANLNSELEKARAAAVPVPAPIVQVSSDEGLKAEIARLEEEKKLAEKKRDELEAEAKRASSELEAARGEAARKQRELEEMKGTYESLLAKLKKEMENGGIKVEMTKEGLSVKIMGKVLFASGSDNISRQGKEVLDRISGILKDVNDNMIRIEGHTDNKSIGPKIIDRFPTNWELSASRATQVVKYLAKRGVDPKMMSAGGLSMYYPVATNDTKEGREQNRRIEIILYPRELTRVE